MMCHWFDLIERIILRDSILSMHTITRLMHMVSEVTQPDMDQELYIAGRLCINQTHSD